MMFYNNGIVIQDIDKEALEFTEQGNFPDDEFETFRAYRGIERYYLSWPLSIEADQISIRLTAETERWFINQLPNDMVSYNLEIIPDRKFCIEYIKHCKAKGIRMRVLFCRTEFEKPIWDSSLPNLKFLGYDYAFIPEDLLAPIKKYLEHPIYKSLIQCNDMLNSNKLFNREEDIRTYLERRKKVAESDINYEYIEGNAYPAHLVEDFEDSLIVHLSEVIGDI